ncbi:Zinc finger, CCHC-type [Sesbania bispinosa]|nr:Zinc finger, CCHC-type [Sesbania bispinosa]
MRCFKCKKVGHIRKNCPQLKNDRNSNASAAVVRSSAAASGESSDEGDGGDVLTKEEVENLAGNKNTDKGVHHKVELEVEASDKENLNPLKQSSNV